MEPVTLVRWPSIGPVGSHSVLSCTQTSMLETSQPTRCASGLGSMEKSSRSECSTRNWPSMRLKRENGHRRSMKAPLDVSS